MTKEELLAKLQAGLDEEERAIPLYTKHLGATLSFSGYTPEVQTKIKELLALLKKESEFHARVYGRLLKAVRGSSQDVF